MTTESDAPMGDEEIEDLTPRATRVQPRPVKAAAAGRKPGRKPGRPKKVESEHEVPIDGYGDPLRVDCVPGWMALLVSDRDAVRLGWRKWEPANWGDPRIKAWRGVPQEEHGRPMRFNELRVFLMTVENYRKAQAMDPRRINHEGLRLKVVQQAEQSRAGGINGFLNVYKPR